MDMNLEPVNANQEVPAEKKVRKPRTAKVAVAPVISHPTLLDGSRDASLENTVEKKFDGIYIMKPDGKHVHYCLKADPSVKGEKAHEVPALFRNAIYAMLNSVLAGQGQGPDGSTQWLVKNWPAIDKFYQGKLGNYVLKAVPAGRAGVQTYSSKIKTWVKIVEDKYALILESLKVSQVAKHQTIVRSASKRKAEPKINF